MSGIDAIYPCLMSHLPISLLIIMLGTNDTKERFSVNPVCIALGMERLVKKALSIDCWRNAKPNILIVSPPPIADGMYSLLPMHSMGVGCVEKSRMLAKYYSDTADRLGVFYFNADGCELNKTDYMHLTKLGHEQLCNRLFEYLTPLLNAI